MVALSAVQTSNARIASSLPPLVSVFVGATAGIGETTLRQFVKHAPTGSRAYFIGRSQESADRITADCQTLNPAVECIFVKADVSLIRAVDVACQAITAKEKSINLLFCTQGTLDTRTETAEGLRYIMALGYYSRFRFVVNLLPLLRQGTGLRRVVMVYAGGYEGKVDLNDFQGRRISYFPSFRNQLSSLITLSHEVMAKQAPNVSFVHDFPGLVETPGLKNIEGIVGSAARLLVRIAGPLICTPIVESGERHLFLATSARYAPSEKGDGSGVPVTEGGGVARGTDGEPGSGVYSVDVKCESVTKPEKLLAEHRRTGVVDKVWQHTEEEFTRITSVDRDA